MNWRIPVFTRRALTMMPALVVLSMAVSTAVFTALNLYLLCATLTDLV